MTNEVKNVPELRFPEFGGEWEEKQLSTILEIGTGKSKVQSNENGKYNILGSTGVIGKSHTYDYEGDFILTARVGHYAGKLYKHAGKVNISDNTIYLFNFINKNFIYESLNLFKLEKLVFGSGQPLIKASDLKKLKIRVPVSKEQKKIGVFFSKLDRQIELEEKKLELLEQQKRGYMQKVFSQELRFKDENGKQYPEGNEYKLNEIGVFNSGIGFPESLQGGIEGIPFFKVSDMNTKGNEIVMKKSNNYVSKEIIDSKKWKVITNGPSMIFAKVGAAIMLNRKRLVLEPFLIDNNTMSYSFSNDWDINFGRILFQTIYLPKYAQVGALPSYNAKDIGTIKVKLPIKQEQEKIGNFFNELDNLIELQVDKIEVLKQRKKGLLQKMFV